MLSLKLSPLLLLSTVSHSHEGGGGNGKASAAREVMTNLIHTYVNDYVIATQKNKQERRKELLKDVPGPRDLPRLGRALLSLQQVLKGQVLPAADRHKREDGHQGLKTLFLNYKKLWEMYLYIVFFSFQGRVCNVCDDKGRCNTADDVVLQFYEYGDVVGHFLQNRSINK